MRAAQILKYGVMPSYFQVISIELNIKAISLCILPSPGVRLTCFQRSFPPCRVSWYRFPDGPVTLLDSSMMSLLWVGVTRGPRRRPQQPEWELRRSWSHRKYTPSVRARASSKSVQTAHQLFVLVFSEVD